jgi:hypothetical protein
MLYAPLKKTMRLSNRIIPYLCLGIASLILLISSQSTSNQEVKGILIAVFSNCVFFFVAYFFYDMIRQKIIRDEKKFLEDYIKNKISNDIFVALYYLKKIIHGYNLDTNKVDNILGIVSYSRSEILSSVRNQNYIGFQVLKNTDEVRDLFGQALNDNLILKYSTHVDSINIIRIANNLAKLESILKTEANFNVCAETAIEFITVNGKEINPDNDDRYLLLKKTQISGRFVVYDSGYFEEDRLDNLLKRYVLKQESMEQVSRLLFETFALMHYWLPDTIRLARNENRFRIIKEFFSLNTNLKTRKTKIYVADIVDK